METLVNPKRIIIKAEMLGIQKKKKKKAILFTANNCSPLEKTPDFLSGPGKLNS